MEGRFIEAIESLTHRSVKAFLSGSRQNIDVSVELFLLDDESPSP
jgi:hypothetical protein